METGSEDLASLMCNLDIANDASGDPEQNLPHPAINDSISLQNAIRSLSGLTTTIFSRTQTVRSLMDDASFSYDLSISEIYSLRDQSQKLIDITCSLQDVAKSLEEAVENSIIKHLRSFGSPSTSTSIVHDLLSHFDKEVREIAREALSHSSGEDLIWKIAEECYHQASSPMGSLDADNYFIPLEEACLAWPYDPEFESEAYYDHEERLAVDEDYNAVSQEQAERRDETHRRNRDRWPEFWIGLLNKSPNGPTLFHPPASHITDLARLDPIPPYLFRTFDQCSSGTNNGRVIASAASRLDSYSSSRTDMLNLEERRATELLHAHLNKDCFGADKSDDLMSWTSSLLFAIQYALWRLRIGSCSASDIKICAIDTRKFSQGQFIQDLWLFQAYNATARQIGGPIRRFFSFRLEREDYYNGEYLSQGVVHHKDRSSIMSLEHLIQAGLFKLYPEFKDTARNVQWTKRVRELRQEWSTEQGTTDQDIRLALSIARDCFTQLEPLDLACILLSFKNRQLRGWKQTSEESNTSPSSRIDYSSNARTEQDHLDFLSRSRPIWADKPAEVYRYWVALNANNSHGKTSHGRLNHSPVQHCEVLRKIFV